MLTRFIIQQNYLKICNFASPEQVKDQTISHMNLSKHLLVFMFRLQRMSPEVIVGRTV